MKKKDVSIILVNYNTKALTEQCIDSIFKNTQELDFEVIVVDNDSHDGSREALQSDNRIKFIESGSNLGFGKANNLGIMNSTGKYVFFLNSDTLLINNAVKYFFDFAEEHKEMRLGGLGCQLLDGDGCHTHSCSFFPKIRKFFEYEIEDHIATIFHIEKPKRMSYPNQAHFDYYKVDYVTGADLFVKRSVLDEYGAFDPDFFMYYEETEMQYRWGKAGHSNLIINGPKIIHLERKSSASANHIAREMRDLRSRILYFRKTSTFLAYLFFRVTLVLFRFHYLLKPSLSKEDKITYFKLILSEQ